MNLALIAGAFGVLIVAALAYIALGALLGLLALLPPQNPPGRRR